MRCRRQRVEDGQGGVAADGTHCRVNGGLQPGRSDGPVSVSAGGRFRRRGQFDHASGAVRCGGDCQGSVSREIPAAAVALVVAVAALVTASVALCPASVAFCVLTSAMAWIVPSSL